MYENMTNEPKFAWYRIDVEVLFGSLHAVRILDEVDIFDGYGTRQRGERDCKICQILCLRQIKASWTTFGLPRHYRAPERHLQLRDCVLAFVDRLVSC